MEGSVYLSPSVPQVRFALFTSTTKTITSPEEEGEKKENKRDKDFYLNLPRRSRAYYRRGYFLRIKKGGNKVVIEI